MALLGKAFRVGQDTGDQPAHGIGHRHGGDLSAGQHKVSQGDLLIDAFLNKTLVDAFVVAADQDEAFVVLLETLGIGLTKNLAGRGEVNGVQTFSRFVTDVFPTLVKGICLHHGPMAAAVGIVVYLLLFV